MIRSGGGAAADLSTTGHAWESHSTTDGDRASRMVDQAQREGVGGMHPSYIPEYPGSKFLIELAHSNSACESELTR